MLENNNEYNANNEKNEILKLTQGGNFPPTSHATLMMQSLLLQSHTTPMMDQSNRAIASLLLFGFAITKQ